MTHRAPIHLFFFSNRTNRHRDEIITVFGTFSTCRHLVAVFQATYVRVCRSAFYEDMLGPLQQRTECERVTRAVIILALGRTEQEDEHR